MVVPCGIGVPKHMDEQHFKLVRKQSVSKQIAKQIKGLITNGQLQPNDKLPSERDLAKSLGVGRLSLREALRILESMGILETKYGVDSGTYVTTISTGDLSKKISEMFMFSNITIGHLTEARLEISMITIKYFIHNAGPKELNELEECLREAEILLKSGRTTREKNLHFHELIAAGSNNPIFVVLHKSLLQILREFISRFESPPDHSKRVLENHKRTLKYLKEKDLEKARSAMRDHILYAGGRMKSLIGRADAAEKNSAFPKNDSNDGSITLHDG